jgi:hypothetical protein
VNLNPPREGDLKINILVGLSFPKGGLKNG